MRIGELNMFVREVLVKNQVGEAVIDPRGACRLYPTGAIHR